MKQDMRAEQLKSILHYEPDTGVFTWLRPVSNRTKAGSVAGSVTDRGYIKIKVNGRNTPAHRLAFLYMLGELPDKYVDHINGKHSDNRWCNLRAVSDEENSKNKPVQRNNKSGMSGVSRRSDFPSWRVNIMFHKRQFNKYFADIKYGGYELSLMAASFFAANKYIEFGFHENHGRQALAAQQEKA